MSRHKPAYVPTASSRPRLTSIVALTVSRSLSTSQPAAVGCAAGPSNGASVVPISQCSPHGTRKTILPGTRIVRPVLFGIRSRDDEMSTSTGQDVERSIPEWVIPDPPPTLRSHRRRRVGISNSSPPRRSVARTAWIAWLAGIGAECHLRGPRVTATAPAATAVPRHGVGGEHRPRPRRDRVRARRGGPPGAASARDRASGSWSAGDARTAVPASPEDVGEGSTRRRGTPFER